MEKKKRGNISNASAGEQHPVPAAAGTRSVNRLNAKEQFLLANAIKEHAERLCRENPALETAAEEFSGLLGFRVSTSSVRTAMTAVDVSWNYGRRHRTGQGSARSARAQLLHALREAVIVLLEENGKQVPNDLTVKILEAGHEFRHGEAVAG